MFGSVIAVDFIGIFGSLLLCSAYWMVARGRLDAEAASYNLLNLGGSLLVLIWLYVEPIPGAVLFEVLLAAIAITAVVGVIRRRKPE